VSVAHYSKTVSSKFNLMKYVLTSLAFLSIVSPAFANTPPTPQVLSAAMRDGTTIMDITYRVDDPDDATVKVRALAFVDGVRSFANVLRPSSFVEGTAGNLGDAVPANTDRTIAWDVGADWEIDLAQVKFEVLAMDGRGLLPIEWVTIPAAGDEPELTISKNSPTDSEVLDALFWQYADEDPGLSLTSGILVGTVRSGVFENMIFSTGASVEEYATAYIFKFMGIAVTERITDAIAARMNIDNTGGWHAENMPWNGISQIVAWGGDNNWGQTTPPGDSFPRIKKIVVGNNHYLVLNLDGTVEGWGWDRDGQGTPPEGLTGVVEIAAGTVHSLAVKQDGSVIGWGQNASGSTSPPEGLTGVTKVAAGTYFSLALKNDGTVVGWGSDSEGQATPPEGLSGVIAIEASGYRSFALKDDGTVVGWGRLSSEHTPPELNDVSAISASPSHCLALKNDGTVVAWGQNSYGEITPPEGLSNVTAIAAGRNFSLVLKSDGTVVGWGKNDKGQIDIPIEATNITFIGSGVDYSLVLAREL
jgi:hypothetical protein